MTSVKSAFREKICWTIASAGDRLRKWYGPSIVEVSIMWEKQMGPKLCNLSLECFCVYYGNFKT